jgi:hypothetical protein
MHVIQFPSGASAASNGSVRLGFPNLTALYVLNNQQRQHIAKILQSPRNQTPPASG